MLAIVGPLAHQLVGSADMARTLLQRFERIIEVIRTCGAICGANVLDRSYRMGGMTWYLIFGIKAFWIFTAYTTYTEYQREGDWTLILKNLCTVGNALQGYCKLLNVICKREDFRSVFKDMPAVYKEYQDKGLEYQACLRVTLAAISRMVKTFGWISVVEPIAMILTCSFYYFVRDMKVYLLHFQVPGINTETMGGYLAVNGIHLSCIFFSIMGNFAGDMMFLLPVCCTSLYSGVFSCKLQDLSTSLATDDFNAKAAAESFRDILCWHQRYLRYLQKLKSSCYWVVGVQVSTSAFSLVATLFCILLDKWPGGHLYFLYTFFILIVYCALGDFVDTTNVAFIHACYGDVLWYKLPIREQKNLLMMLRTSQRVLGLHVAGVSRLNLQLAIRLTKTMYSCTMLFLNFVS